MSILVNSATKVICQGFTGKQVLAGSVLSVTSVDYLDAAARVMVSAVRSA